MVTHDKVKETFQISQKESISYLTYHISNHILTVYHTVVPQELRGRGLAAKLAEAVYAWAKEKNYTIHSECSYMSAWLKHHENQKS